MKQPRYSRLAIVGLIFSLFFFIPLFSVVAIVLGILALKRMPKTKEKGREMAISAIVIGSFVTLIHFLMFSFIAWSFATLYGGVFTPGLTIDQRMDACMNKPQGLARDLCITSAVAAYPEEAGELAPDTCDTRILNSDMRVHCNAIVKRDPAYCAGLAQREQRVECYGIVGELQRNATIS